MIRNRMQTLTLLLAVVAVPFAFGCGPAATTGQFVVTISSGTTPTFTWDASEGTAAGLAIAEYPGTSVRMWVLSTLGTGGISSGVKYGTTPAGGIEASGAAKPLVAGTQYDVTVTASNGSRSGHGIFTP